MEKKAMKTIRQDILAALLKHGEQTIDDLMLRLPDYEQKQIVSNIQPARADDLIASRRDDVTGRPAYRITDKGKARLEELKACTAQVEPAKVAKPRDIPVTHSHVTIKLPPSPSATAEVISKLQNEVRVQAERGDMLGKSLVEFLEWLGSSTDCKKMPLSLAEARAVVEGLTIQINTLNHKLQAQKADVKAEKKPQQPRRPFSVTGLNGYHAGGEKVTLFLDRRLNARSITLEAEKLNQLADMARAA